MELSKEILIHALTQGRIRIDFPDLGASLTEVIEMECYQALQKIKTILDDDSLDDPECFRRIEEIVLVFEELGSSGGSRHDFG